MYIIKNNKTEQIELATNRIIVSTFTEIKIHKLNYIFGKKKSKIFETVKYTIIKKVPLPQQE